MFERGTTDRFFIAIEATDPRFDPLRTKALLETVGAVRVATVEA
ncbi:MAG: quinol:electron acceptor oxidoreductase subunit ActD [Thermoanaerobaculales bacterium]